MKQINNISDEVLWHMLGKRIENVYEKDQIDQLVLSLNEVSCKMEDIVSQFKKEWLTMDEAMEYLNIKSNCFRDWRVEGLQVSSVGRKIYVSQTEINRFLRERQI